MGGNLSKPVCELTPEDFRAYPAWEYAANEGDLDDDETRAWPIAHYPVTDLSNRFIGTTAILNNGMALPACLGNVVLQDPRATRASLALNVWHDDEWVDLSPGGSAEQGEAGPERFARQLGLSVSQVFPIRYDISAHAKGLKSVVQGTIEAPAADLAALVTIASYDVRVQAEVDRTLLEEENIPALVADDNFVATNRLFSAAVGGARLQVPAALADRAREILRTSRTSRTKLLEGPAGEEVTFACQTCQKSITFPADRRGHVEACPLCDNYVDVPEDAAGLCVDVPEETADLPAEEPQTSASDSTRLQIGDGAISCVTRGDEGDSPQIAPARPRAVDSPSRTNGQVWIEVLAVLCLFYVPAMFGVLSDTVGWPSASRSFIDIQLWRIVRALQISLPLLAIMALAKDRWSPYGIVRPRWIIDVLVGCIIWGCGVVASDIVVSMLPSSALHATAFAEAAVRRVPHGIAAHFLLLLAVAASAFEQELVMRAYLIARLERLLQSTVLAVVVTTALYGSYHLYQGVAGAVGAAAGGFVYAVAFCLSRRLWPLCVAHTLHNFILQM